MTAVSQAEFDDLVSGIKADIRSDGRRRREWREFTVELGVAPHAQGSAFIDLGGTQVVAGVTVTVGEAAEGVEQGSITLYVDISSSAVLGQEGDTKDLFSLQRTLKGLSASVAQVLGRMLGASTGLTFSPDPLTQLVGFTLRPNPAQRGGFNYGSLYVGAGQAFNLTIDISVLSLLGGSIFSAAAIAVKAALLTTKLPKASVSAPIGGDVSVTLDPDPSTARPLAVEGLPILIGIIPYAGYYVVDPSYDEEVLPTTFLLAALQGKVYFSTTVASLRSGVSCRTPSGATGTKPATEHYVYGQDLAVLLEEGLVSCDEINSFLLKQVREAQDAE